MKRWFLAAAPPALAAVVAVPAVAVVFISGSNAAALADSTCSPAPVAAAPVVEKQPDALDPAGADLWARAVRDARWPATQWVKAVAVVGAESRYRPEVRNSIGASGGFQVLRSAHPEFAEQWADGSWKDPVVNARMGLSVWKEREASGRDGWGAWTTVTGADTPGGEKTYLRYLKEAQAAVDRLGDTPAVVPAVAERQPAVPCPEQADPKGAKPAQVVQPVFPAGTGAGCGKPVFGGFSNGQIPDSALCALSVGRGHKLRADAAAAFEQMMAAGAPVCVTDSYRNYAAQVAVRAAKPGLAAVPGTSNHGWGVAIDFGCGVERFGTSAHRWMQQNAGRFGWVHPGWAQAGGSKPEPWHWEYAP